METDSIRRFLDKYIEKTKKYGVSKTSARWYVNYVETYTKGHPTLRLANHKAVTLENYLRDLGRIRRLTDWRFKQMVEALKILFVEIILPTWAHSFPWEFWTEAASQLPDSHATVARDYSQPPPVEDPIGTHNNGDKGALENARLMYPD